MPATTRTATTRSWGPPMRAGAKAGIQKGVRMDPKQFAELHAKCWETLKHYVHEADRMCELFGQCLPESSSIQFRSEIMRQRILENNAHANYFEIRRQLF